MSQPVFWVEVASSVQERRSTAGIGAVGKGEGVSTFIFFTNRKEESSFLVYLHCKNHCEIHSNLLFYTQFNIVNTIQNCIFYDKNQFTLENHSSQSIPVKKITVVKDYCLYCIHVMIVYFE